MYMITCTLKRFKEEGCKEEDEILLRVAVESGFEKIDTAFLGIYANLASGPLAYIFKICAFFSKLNSLSSPVKDNDLHTITQTMNTDKDFFSRVCSNIFYSQRIKELAQTSILMNESKYLFEKLKKSGIDSLNKEEQKQMNHVLKMQKNVISVDSFTDKEYFH